VEFAAHSLKGAIGNFSTKGVYLTALELEMSGQTGDLGGAHDLIAKLEEQMDALNQTLSGLAQEPVR